MNSIPTQSTSSSNASETEKDFNKKVNKLPLVEYKNPGVILKQYVSSVIDFSSQYGSDYSISYTAFNITGKPCKYPDYGDFPETYAMVKSMN